VPDVVDMSAQSALVVPPLAGAVEASSPLGVDEAGVVEPLALLPPLPPSAPAPADGDALLESLLETGAGPVEFDGPAFDDPPLLPAQPAIPTTHKKTAVD